MQGKENRKEKQEERKSEDKYKIDLKLTNYFYLLFQNHLTHFTYFNSSM